jgi:hypothetical protein
MELGLVQSGAKQLPSYTFGFRYAMSPRWTIAGTWQGAIKGTLPLNARIDPANQNLVGISGYGSAYPYTAPVVPVLMANSSASAGNGSICLPGRLTFGVRQRVNQIFTWEGDLHYVRGTSLLLPTYPILTTPSGAVSGSGVADNLHNGTGLSLMGEIALSKLLTARIGVSQEAGLKEDPSVEPVLGGSRASNFAAGIGYKAFGGELNVGWMTRLSQDRDVKNLDGTWSLNGPGTTGTLTRVEDMGHLWSVGFKKSF